MRRDVNIAEKSHAEDSRNVILGLLDTVDLQESQDLKDDSSWALDLCQLGRRLICLQNLSSLIKPYKRVKTPFMQDYLALLGKQLLPGTSWKQSSKRSLLNGPLMQGCRQRLALES